MYLEWFFSFGDLEVMAWLEFRGGLNFKSDGFTLLLL